MAQARLTKQPNILVDSPERGGLPRFNDWHPDRLDNMSPNNLFIKNLAAIPIAEGVIANSIIAVDSDAPLDEAGDGAVNI